MSCGPSAGAMPVSSTTKTVATTIRAGSPTRVAPPHLIGCVLRRAGKRARPPAREQTAPPRGPSRTLAKSGSGEQGDEPERSRFDTANARLLTARGSGQRWRWASQPYTTQKAACETVPAIVPAAAVAANAGLVAQRQKERDGRGGRRESRRPALTAGPKRRPARLAMPISAGVRTSFRMSVSTTIGA